MGRLLKDTLIPAGGITPAKTSSPQLGIPSLSTDNDRKLLRQKKFCNEIASCLDYLEHYCYSYLEHDNFRTVFQEWCSDLPADPGSDPLRHRLGSASGRGAAAD